MIAIRGATTANQNTEKDILDASSELFLRIVEANSLAESDIVSVIATVTGDLTEVAAVKAVRNAGYTQTPLFSALEPSVKGMPERCVRMMVFVEKGTKDTAKHIYLKGAAALRPDWAAATD